MRCLITYQGWENPHNNRQRTTRNLVFMSTTYKFSEISELIAPDNLVKIKYLRINIWNLAAC